MPVPALFPYSGGMSIFGFLILGLAVGCIARMIVPGRIGNGWLSALVCGVVGALVGGFLSSLIFHVGLGSFWNPRTWIVAIIGSVIVLFVWGKIGKAAK